MKKFENWSKYFTQEHKDFVDSHNWEYWLTCATCGVITNDIYRDDEGDECEECHNERYKDNPNGWLFKYYFDNDLTDEQKESMKNWTDKDFEENCDWYAGENYYYTEIYEPPRDSDKDMVEYIEERLIELEKKGIYIDWRD